MKQMDKIHFTHKYILHPPNPVTVNLIGAGGTGSQLLTALARMNHALIALQHPGLSLRLFDDDFVTAANLGRQLFAQSELGMKKSIALINRINRFFGTNWKAVPLKYTPSLLVKRLSVIPAAITISCVDSVQSRFEIEGMLKTFAASNDSQTRDQLFYWMDFGNDQTTGQVILSTINDIEQPVSKKYITVNKLPCITEEFKGLLERSGSTDTPSCSLAEALTKQDLFINSTLANLGASLLWNLFRVGMTANRGFFLNLKDFRVQPLKIV